MGQSIATIVLSSMPIFIFVLAGWFVFKGSTYVMGVLFFGFIIWITILILWFFWAFLIYILGTKILNEQKTNSNISEFIRTVGFSSSPQIFRVEAAIPLLFPILIVPVIWTLVAMIIAVREALDYKSI